MGGAEPEMKRYMDDKLYTAARDGNKEYLEEIGTPSREGENHVQESPYEHYLLTQTLEGDNILHLAASRDRLGFIIRALEKIPAIVMLICRSNYQGENPLHVAARLGHLEIVQVLVTSYKSHLQDAKEGKLRSSLLSLMVNEGTGSSEPWMARDSRGNTPLHEALKNGYEEVAVYLLEVEPQLACYENNADESTLFLAAAYGHENVVEMILSSEVSYSLSAPVGLTPLHAVVHNCTERAAALLLEKQPQLAKKADNRKKTALYYAAEANKDKHIKTILETERSCAYQRDDNGLTPLLRAASLGQLLAVRAILAHCPQSITICDNDGKTAVHLLELNSYHGGLEVLRIPAMGRLINEPDMEGNTPLHLAAKNSDHIKAKVLIDTGKAELTMRNKEGLTPWDIIKLQPEPSENMAEIGYQLVMHSTDKQTQTEHLYQPQVKDHGTARPEDVSQVLQRKFNSLRLIAAVLAAVTFAAGFAIPGGIDGSGHAVLTKQAEFKVFVLSNTTAMCGYTFVLISALWAMMITRRDDEPRFLLSFSIHILQLSFYASLVAFVSSMYALISAKSLWLAIAVVCLPPCVVILTISKSVVFRLARFFARLRLY